MFKQEINKQRFRALEENIDEYNYLKQLNADVQHKNEGRARVRQRKRLYMWFSERLYKYNKIKKDNKKGGMDFM